jgi:hypothetical protein
MSASEKRDCPPAAECRFNARASTASQPDSSSAAWERSCGSEVFETELLTRPVRTYVECVRLTEEALEPRLLEIDFDAAADSFSADALMSTLRLGDMQVHIRAFSENDLIATREANGLIVEQPDHEEAESFVQGQRELVLETFAPSIRCWQTCRIHGLAVIEGFLC